MIACSEENLGVYCRITPNFNIDDTALFHGPGCKNMNNLPYVKIISLDNTYSKQFRVKTLCCKDRTYYVSATYLSALSAHELIALKVKL